MAPFRSVDHPPPRARPRPPPLLLPKSTSSPNIIPTNSSPTSSSSSSLLPASQPKKMKPFILRAKSPALTQGPFAVGSPPSGRTVSAAAAAAASVGASDFVVGGGLQGMTRAVSLGRVGNWGVAGSRPRGGQVGRLPPMPASSSAGPVPSTSRFQLDVNLAPLSSAQKAAAVEAHKMTRQRDAAATRRASSISFNRRPSTTPVIRPDSPTNTRPHLTAKGKQRAVRRQASLADLSNGQRTAPAPNTTNASAAEDTYPPRQRQRQPTTDSDQTVRTPVEQAFGAAGTPTPTRQALRRVASMARSPVRTPQGKARPDARKAKSYANLRPRGPAVDLGKAEKEHVSGFTSLQELLEQQGFEHTRVFTPKRPPPLHRLDLASPPSSDRSPNPQHTSASASLGALLHPSRAGPRSLKPQASMLSLRGLMGMWHGPGVDVEPGPIELSPDCTPTQAAFPIDMDEGGSDAGSDGTAVERSVCRANEWVWTQAGLESGEAGGWGTQFATEWRGRGASSAAGGRVRRRSDEAERSVVLSSTGLSSVASKPSNEGLGLGLAVLESAGPGASGASDAASYAADYRSRPGLGRTVSDMPARPDSSHALRHVASNPALSGPAASYASFGLAGLAFAPAAGGGMDGRGGEASSIEYDGSSSSSLAGNSAIQLSTPAPSPRPLEGFWSGVSALTHRASALFLAPPVQPGVQEAQADDGKGPELLRKARSRVALKPVVSSAELRFEFGAGTVRV